MKFPTHEKKYYPVSGLNIQPSMSDFRKISSFSFKDSNAW